MHDDPFIPELPKSKEQRRAEALRQRQQAEASGQQEPRPRAPPRFEPPPKNAAEQQRRQIAQLQRQIADQGRQIRIPTLEDVQAGKQANSDVPEFIRHVPGSVTASGSGDFHIYRRLRRREQTRQAAMSAEAEAEERARDSREAKEQLNAQESQKADRKRRKRQREKERKRQAGSQGSNPPSANGDDNEDDGDSAESNDDANHTTKASVKMNPLSKPGIGMADPSSIRASTTDAAAFKVPAVPAPGSVPVKQVDNFKIIDEDEF